jgi:hypothetical protein
MGGFRSMSQTRLRFCLNVFTDVADLDLAAWTRVGDTLIWASTEHNGGPDLRIVNVAAFIEERRGELLK